ncbi:MAG: type II toxin-antitoxin system VapC family toxin [Defluviitaleaceae bacterium]|nr:type II toxin-antitoxin system VapC family toxin [Defluviitaleaceae bacterium]
MPSIYIETTIPSLATSKPSRDIITAGRQASTLLFWETERHKYDLYISQYIIDECSLGDSEAAERRLNFIKGIPIIPYDKNIIDLANTYQKLLDIPEKSKIDCFHLAVCVVAGLDYMLSWNCTHLGVRTFAKLQNYNAIHGMHTPLLLTPEALMEMED